MCTLGNTEEGRELHPQMFSPGRAKPPCELEQEVRADQLPPELRPVAAAGEGGQTDGGGVCLHRGQWCRSAGCSQCLCQCSL